MLGGLLFVLHQTGHNPFAAKVVIPQVYPGESLTVVDSRLRAVGLNTEWFSDDTTSVPFGAVTRIDPSSGSEVPPHTTVAIWHNTRLGA
jgi:hypothetical protein